VYGWLTASLSQVLRGVVLYYDDDDDDDETTRLTTRYWQLVAVDKGTELRV